jgi:hypothetical protein
LGAHLPVASPTRSHHEPNAQSFETLHGAPALPRGPHLPLTHERPREQTSFLPQALPWLTRGWHVDPSQ